MSIDNKASSRRRFLQLSGTMAGGALFANMLPASSFAAAHAKSPVSLGAHLWVYASRYPPEWDCTPILDEVFSDLKYAGLEGVELMEVILRREDAVPRLKALVKKHSLPVTGTSYNADMWNSMKKQEILEDIDRVLKSLHEVGGTMIGITVGSAGHQKSEAELDAQADVLKQIMLICKKHNIQPNLHNHTFEVENELHDLKGTLKRIPDIKLGPDLNWLIRGGVDPVWFINTYGHQMVYMHLRDQRADGKWTEAVGEGVTDFPAIARALKKIQYGGKAAIELAFDAPPQNPVREDWRKSRDYVKKVFGW